MRIHVRSLAPGLTAGGSLVPFVSQLAAPRLYPGQEPCSGTAPGQPQAGSWQGNKQPLCSGKGEAQGGVAGHHPHGTGGPAGLSGGCDSSSSTIQQQSELLSSAELPPRA